VFTPVASAARQTDLSGATLRPMRLVTPRSEVVASDDLTWLRPVESSTRARHTLGTFLLAVLILAGGATATLLPPAAALPVTAAVIAAGLALLVAIVRGAGSRLALSDVGVYLENGGSAHQVGWAAVRGLYGRPVRGRVRVVVDDGYRPRSTRATFELAAARDWLELAAAEAQRRQLQPLSRPDGLGFTT
jgi:hypothetical protein